MKKMHYWAAATAAVALVATGCNSGGTPTTGTESPGGGSQQQTTTISIMASQDWVKDPEFELAKKFEEETGIHIDYQISPADQYPTLLTTKLNSGEAADIFMNQAGKFDIVSQMQIEKNGVDLTDQEWVSRFQPAVKEQVSVGDTVFGITIWDVADSFSYIYNKTIFAELGIAVPTSYAEFKEACAKLQAAGITPVFEPMADGWHHQLNFFDVSAAYDAFRPTMVDDLNTNKITLAEAGIFKTMIEQMKEIYDAGYWGEFAESNTSGDMPSELSDGNYAMSTAIMAGIAAIDAVGGKYTEADFGIFPAPYLDNKIISETPVGPSKFIFSGSKNIEAAKQYLAFLASPESLQYLIDNEPVINALPFDGLQPTFSDAMKEAVATFKPGTSTVYQNAVLYLNPQWMDFGADLAAYLAGDMDADRVISNLDQRRADQATIAKDENWQK